MINQKKVESKGFNIKIVESIHSYTYTYTYAIQKCLVNSRRKSQEAWHSPRYHAFLGNQLILKKKIYLEKVQTKILIESLDQLSSVIQMLMLAWVNHFRYLLLQLEHQLWTHIRAPFCSLLSYLTPILVFLD